MASHQHLDLPSNAPCLGVQELARRHHSRKRPRAKEDLQKLARLVSSGVGHQISALKRQAGRLQQRAKEQRGAKRAAKQAERKRQKPDGHRFL